MTRLTENQRYNAYILLRKERRFLINKKDFSSCEESAAWH